MKYTIQKRFIEEYEVEAENEKEAMSLLYDMLPEETNPKLKIISREDSLKILKKSVNKNELCSIPDGNDYNYTGYRPFSNKDGQKLEEYRFTDRTSTGRSPY